MCDLSVQMHYGATVCLHTYETEKYSVHAILFQFILFQSCDWKSPKKKKDSSFTSIVFVSEIHSRSCYPTAIPLDINARPVD